MEILERSGNGAARRCMAPTSVRRAAHLLWLTLVACGHAQNVAPAPTSAETPIAKPAPVTPLVSLTVLPVVSKNLDPGVVGMVTSVLTAEVHAVPGYSVITVDDLNARLTLEKQKDLLSCSEEKCMTEIGGALGVPHSVVIGGRNRRDTGPPAHLDSDQRWENTRAHLRVCYRPRRCAHSHHAPGSPQAVRAAGGPARDPETRRADRAAPHGVASTDTAPHS